MATNGNFNHQEQYAPPPASTDASSVAAAESSTSTATPSKDEVGWYFVEQYYNTLSKNPSKLHLFYNKRSQFVQGPEAELVNVAVGRPAIQERIKELDFQDCKVRVSNVDSQASFENIVIQVIGEISNKSGEPKKFVQTFVLAAQPAGYYLLNDILRYINEGDDETTEDAVEEPAAVAEAEAEAAQEPTPEPEPEPIQAEEPAEDQPAALDAQAVDKKLEESSSVAKDTPATSAVETPAEPAAAAPETASKPEVVETAAAPEEVTKDVASEETKKPELPKEPSPTPAPAPAAAAPEPEKPKGPPKPMTWASLAAAGSGKPGPVKPAIPLPNKAAAPASPAQTRPAAAAPAAATPAPAAAPGAQSSAPAQPADAPASKETSQANEWRTAGADSKRQSRQHPSATPAAEKEGTLAYVKFVNEKVKDDELKAALEGFGGLVYFDVNRQKSCAFVEYATAPSCQAAIKASPISVQGESIVIETRRPKASAYGGANYNTNRGGAAGRGRGAYDGNRSGSQGGGRGGFTGRGRGAPRGRGGAQATNA